MHWVSRWNSSEHYISFQGVMVNSIATCLQLTMGQEKNLRVTSALWDPSHDQDNLIQGLLDASQEQKLFIGQLSFVFLLVNFLIYIYIYWKFNFLKL